MTRIEDRAAADFGEDRFLIWPFVLVCSFPVFLIALWAGPFGLAVFGAPILFALWMCSIFVTLVIAVHSARGRRWRQALSLAVFPIATLIAIANADLVWSLAAETGERIHFQVMRRSYLDDVSKLPSTGEPRFRIWQWGGFVVGHAVVYDESDEILAREPSPAWKKRVADTEVGACGAWGTPLGNHFYLVRTGC
jgi:hypothetical protein